MGSRNRQAENHKSNQGFKTAASYRPLRAGSTLYKKLLHVNDERERDPAIVPFTPHSAHVDCQTLRSVARSDDSTTDSHLSFSHLESPGESSGEKPPDRAICETCGRPGEEVGHRYGWLHRGVHEKREEAIYDYLVTDPESLLPSRSQLEKLKGTAMNEIHSAVRDLLEGTGTKYDKFPQFDSSLSSSSLFAIFKRIFGVGRIEDIKPFVTPQPYNPSILRDCLRSIIAAAINEWVFDGAHEFLPSDLDKKTGISEVYETELARLYPELHEQILRKSKYAFLTQTLDPNAFVPQLSFRLNDTLSPFLAANLATIDSKIMETWYTGLKKIALAALQLRRQVMLREQLYFMWPRAGDPFIGDTMMTENRSHVDETGTVQLGLFPALFQTLDEGTTIKAPKPEMIFPAVVTLQ